ncbi:hypothetical protein GBW32_05835 [Streptomyces tsukubensis]|uniref:Uncharacterized protein n=1 Tax=Streptomyces tsukubensis TaxID=83656 RepID=A0A1V4AEE4_9ACTN|nr:hypothetical protein B1H18_03810 [Streptomyces tsukubensis]QFR92665.1 hypothetical protein GBW32_05835 [Streptomyces tsukubensis]
MGTPPRQSSPYGVRRGPRAPRHGAPPAYNAEREPHARRFAREDDAPLDGHFTKTEHIAAGADGPPGLPPPLPPSTF